MGSVKHNVLKKTDVHFVPIATAKMLFLKITFCGLVRIVRYKIRTTDQKVSGSTPDGCAIHLQALTKYKNSATAFFS
jgi:hypothetical protein